MNRQFVGEIFSAPRGLDGIDIADQIGDGDIGRCQFFYIAFVWREVRDVGFVTESRNFVAAATASATSTFRA